MVNKKPLYILGLEMGNVNYEHINYLDELRYEFGEGNCKQWKYQLFLKMVSYYLKI